MKTSYRIILLCSLFLVAQCGFSQKINVKNNSSETIRDYVVEIPIKKLPLSIGNYFVVSDNGVQVPLEVVTDIHGEQKAVFPIEKMAPNSNNIFSVKKGSANRYPKRTYAEISHKIGGEFVGNKYEGGFSWVKPNYLKVSGDFKDHAYYIKYEGPGWESDKVAYRFYLDQRNGIDAFGKKTPGIVLPGVGADGYQNYHEMADWGMDHLKVGKTLGVGTIAYWNGEKAVRVEERDSVVSYIAADGKVRSQVMTTFYGWNIGGVKCDLQSLISIDAGSRAAHMELLTDKSVKNLATGIIKSKNTDLIIPEDTENEWTYIATFGKQSLNNDNQGLAIFYKKSQLKTITEDELNHLIIFSPSKGFLEYYFMSTWEMDWEPVKDKNDFIIAINEVLDRLNQPINIHIKSK